MGDKNNMNVNNKKNEREFEFCRYIPQHPLPEEIRNLERKDTICKYCGVSYLIHNEIKVLEEKLAATEKELVHFRGQEKREELLAKEVGLLKTQKTDLQSSLETTAKMLSLLNVEGESMKEQNKKLETSLTSYKTKYMSCLRHLSSLSQTVRQQRKTLQEMRQQVSHTQSWLSEQITVCSQSTQVISQTALRETSELESRLGCLEMEKVVLSEATHNLTEANRKLAESVKAKEEEIQSQQGLISTLKESLHRNEASLLEQKELNNVLQAVKRELEESRTECRVLTVELDQYKIQLRNKTTELANLTNLRKEQEQAHEVTLQKLHLEMKAKESELVACTRQLKKLDSQCQEHQHKEQEANQQKNLGLSEIQGLRDSLHRLKSDNEALKAERELMIEAHQNRIQDLRESFKQKLAETELWPVKLQEAIKEEKLRHQSEIKLLEEGLKHNFNLELQIEKDKYNELLKKIQAQENDKSNMREVQQTLQEQKYQQDIEGLQHQLVEVRGQSQEREEELRKEVKGLKKIISDLQDRLARLDSVDSNKLSELRNDFSKTQQWLQEAETSARQLESKLKEVTNENILLQNIVKRECEERTELTEALGAAKKELLQLKKPLVGYSNSSKRGSSTSVHSGSSQGFQSRNSQETTPLQSGPTTLEDPMSKLKSPLPTSSVNLSYPGKSSSGQHSGGSHSSDKNPSLEILKSQRRIASMMGRHL